MTWTMSSVNFSNASINTLSDNNVVVHATIEKGFPQLSQCNKPLSKKQLQDTISTLVLACMILKTTVPDCDMVAREERAGLICQQIFNHYPEHAFFQLLLCWAICKKFHFIKDALNTLIVLNSYFPGKQLSIFLLESQDFCISPPSARCPKLKVSYVGVGDESIAQKIDCKILLTYCTVLTTHNIFISCVCMVDSLRQKQVFSVDVT